MNEEENKAAQNLALDSGNKLLFEMLQRAYRGESPEFLLDEMFSYSRELFLDLFRRANHGESPEFLINELVAYRKELLKGS